MAGTPNTAVTFTAGETQFLLCVLRNVEGGVKFNRDAVAQELGLKDGGVAGARWNTIYRTKIKAEQKDDKAAGTSSQKSASSGGKISGKKRGRKAKTEPDDDEETVDVKVAKTESYDDLEG